MDTYIHMYIDVSLSNCRKCGEINFHNFFVSFVFMLVHDGSFFLVSVGDIPFWSQVPKLFEGNTQSS